MEQVPFTPPPMICVNDRVLLHYAVLNESVGYNSGHGLMFVGAKEIGKVPCLAICQDKDTPEFTLYYCDSDWSPIGIASYDTVAAAKRRAERIYPGSSACWVEANFTEEDAARYVGEKWAEQRCSFCGKGPDETLAATFEGNENARICGKCIEEFYAELKRSDPD